jgi:hypothetical protein
MNNLTFNQLKTPFSFLTIQPTKSYPSNNCGLAWCYDQFHLEGNNYYLYACHSGEHIQIKKGKSAKEILNWGGLDV